MDERLCDFEAVPLVFPLIGNFRAKFPQHVNSKPADRPVIEWRGNIGRRLFEWIEWGAVVFGDNGERLAVRLERDAEPGIGTFCETVGNHVCDPLFQDKVDLVENLFAPSLFPRTGERAFEQRFPVARRLPRFEMK